MPRQVLEVPELKKMANTIRRDIIEMLLEAKSGHSGGSLSLTDILVALYFNQMEHDPENPEWEGRDRFVLSKGHCCPTLYAVLARSGYYDSGELCTLRKLGTRLQGHPCKDKGLPGLEVSTGSLGQGLSIGVGMALAAKADGADWMTWVSNGDGELQEGSIWEAAMSAANFKLDNLVSIVDKNRLQIDGWVKDVMDIEPIDAKFEAFGWEVIKCDGHDMEALVAAYEQARASKNGKPKVVIADTVKGKGVSFMEDVAGWHGKTPNAEEAAKALAELEEEAKTF